MAKATLYKKTETLAQLYKAFGTNRFTLCEAQGAGIDTCGATLRALSQEKLVEAKDEVVAGCPKRVRFYKLNEWETKCLMVRFGFIKLDDPCDVAAYTKRKKRAHIT